MPERWGAFLIFGPEILGVATNTTIRRFPVASRLITTCLIYFDNSFLMSREIWLSWPVQHKESLKLLLPLKKTRLSAFLQQLKDGVGLNARQESGITI